MGVVDNITHEKFPKQGNWLGLRCTVCFNYDTTHVIEGEIIREDVESPGVMIIRLDDGRCVLSTECQYKPKCIGPDVELRQIEMVCRMEADSCEVRSRIRKISPPLLGHMLGMIAGTCLKTVREMEAVAPDQAEDMKVNFKVALERTVQGGDAFGMSARQRD